MIIYITHTSPLWGGGVCMYIYAREGSIFYIKVKDLWGISHLITHFWCDIYQYSHIWCEIVQIFTHRTLKCDIYHLLQLYPPPGVS